MAVDAFLKVSNIQGESQDSAFTNQIEVLSFSWGVTQPAHVSGGGQGAGKATLGDLTVTKRYDKSSPPLFAACVAGTHLSSVVLSLRKAGGSTSAGGYIYLTYTLTDAFVTEVHDSSSSEVVLESVSFAYSKLAIEYFQQQSTGAVGSTGAKGYDLVKNAPF
jgi:type VI secretion system secreted protein Hcp